MTRAWSIVITGDMGQCDDKDLEHCDDNVDRALLIQGSWDILMSEVIEH